MYRNALPQIPFKPCRGVLSGHPYRVKKERLGVGFCFYKQVIPNGIQNLAKSTPDQQKMSAQMAKSAFDLTFSKTEKPFSVLEKPFSVLEKPLSVFDLPLSAFDLPLSVLDLVKSGLELVSFGFELGFSVAGKGFSGPELSFPCSN